MVLLNFITQNSLSPYEIFILKESNIENYEPDIA